MSDAAGDRRAQLDLDDLASRVERQRAETGKFVAEEAKLISEQMKLSAEAEKLNRDLWLAPVIAISTSLAAIGATITAVAALLRH